MSEQNAAAAPAFPVTAGHQVYALGMTQRAYAAAAAMQGLLAAGEAVLPPAKLAEVAVDYADALLAEIERASPAIASARREALEEAAALVDAIEADVVALLGNAGELRDVAAAIRALAERKP